LIWYALKQYDWNMLLSAQQGPDADAALVDDDDNGKPGSVRPVISDEERQRIKRMGILTGLAIALHNCMLSGRRMTLCLGMCFSALELH
jgi:hypothetical protein